MPRPKISSSSRIAKCVKRYPKEFSGDKQVLYCLLCETNVAHERTCDIARHRASKQHATRLSDMRQAAHQRLLTEPVSVTASSSETSIAGIQKMNRQEREEFWMDTCSFFVENDIALSKLNSAVTKRYFDKYVKLHLPDESTLRKVRKLEFYVEM